MSALFRTSRNFVIAFAAALLISGCGSSGTNNDQGVAFTLLGFFPNTIIEDELPGCEEIPAGLLGVSVPLSSDTEGVGSTGGTLAVLGLQNNLSGQFIRTERVFLEYNIPGATRQPPSTSEVSTQTISPFNGEDGEGSSINTTLPGGFAQADCNKTYGQFWVVAPEVMQWISLNRNALPEPPFKGSVRVTVTGISSSGDRYTTNPADLEIVFTTDNVVIPSSGSGDDEEA